jgi:hypothetical protein
MAIRIASRTVEYRGAARQTAAQVDANRAGRIREAGFVNELDGAFVPTPLISGC